MTVSHHAQASDDGAGAMLARPAVDEDGVLPRVHHHRQRGRHLAPIHLLTVRLVALHRQVVVCDPLGRQEGAVLRRVTVQQVDDGAQAQAHQEGV